MPDFLIQAFQRGPRRCVRTLSLHLGAGCLLLAPTAGAQVARPTDPGELIPDAAVADPFAWAGAPPPAESPPAANPPSPANPPAATEPTEAPADTPTNTLRPDSPLAPMPEIAIPWPDSEKELNLPAFTALEPESDLAPTLRAAVQALPDRQGAGNSRRRQGRRQAGPTANDTATTRYLLAYPDTTAFPERAEFEERFKSLSALQTLSGKDQANIGQIAVRAASDRELLERLLRTYGYYEGEVLQTLSGGMASAGAKANANPGANPGAGNRVRFDVTPGNRFRFGTIELGDLASTGADLPKLRESFAIHTGDPLHADAIPLERGHLDTALGENGYPFAKIGEPSLLVDHRGETGDLTMPVTPGGKYRFGVVTSSLPNYLSSRHLAHIARFKPGQTWQRSQVDDLRRAILATGLVSSVVVTPRETLAPSADAPGIAALDVAIAKAPQRTMAGALGYDTGEGFRVEASWEHRNLFPPEGMLRFRGVLGTVEQLAGATFRRNNLGGRDRMLTVDLYADNANLIAYAARKVAFSATYERLTTLLFQKPWTWSAGLELEASDEREGVPSGIITGRTAYYTAAVPLRIAFDHSDDLLNPVRGWRAAFRVSPEIARSRGSNAAYARLQFDGSAYLPASDRLVIAGRVRLGAIPGADIDSIAPSRRFYAGGGGSIRGYGYYEVGPRNALGEPKGGRSLYEFSIETRVKTGLFDGALALVPFLDAGGADTSAFPHFADMRYGVGLGLRYQTGFGPIRLDVGTPLGRRPGESRIGVYVALGQAF